MNDLSADQLLERTHQRSRLLRRHVEPEHFDGDKPLGPAACRFVRAKHRTEGAGADLMENAKRPECLWWEVQD